MFCRRSPSRFQLRELPALTRLVPVLAALLLIQTSRPALAVDPPASAGVAAPPANVAAAPAIALPAGVTRGASVEGITEYRLANGLRVLMFPDNSKPTITVNITYLVGSRHEGYGETGMAHLIEHMIFKGTPKHPDIPQELTAHGCRPNGTTWYDRTNYFETFSATDENLDWALGLEADRMVNCNMAAKDLASEFSVVRNEFEVGENYPQQVLMDRVMSTAYLWHNYGKSTIGSRSDIERVPIENLRAFYKTWYQPDNAVLVVAGDVDEEKALAKVAATFGGIPKPARVMPSTYTIEPAQDGERTVTLRRIGDVQMVGVAYHVPAGSHPDYAPLSVLAFILGDTPAGRLHKALVETHKASWLFGYVQQYHDPGMINFFAEVPVANSLDEVHDIMLRVTEGLAATPPTAEEVERARDAEIRYWETTMRNSESAAIDLTEWAAMGDWRLMFLNRDRIKAVTADDVRRVAAAYLKPENRTVGYYIPTKEPARAEIPPTPDVESLVAGYRGGEAIAKGEDFEATPANIEARAIRASLPPGIRLVMVPKKNRGGTVFGSLAFRFGDVNSLKGRSTAGDLAGSLLMRGSTGHSRQQIQDTFDKLKSNVSVNGDATTAWASFETTRENLPATLRLIAEILKQPAFPDSEFAQLVQEQITGYEDMKTDPYQIASTRLEKHLDPWPKDDPRYVRSPEEAIEAIRAARLDELRQFHRDFYGASNAQISVVGDFDAKEVQALLTDLFGEWKSPKPYARLVSEFQDRPAIDEMIEAPDKESATMLAGIRFPARDDDPDYPGLAFGNFMLGGGFLNSRLADRLRQKDGLSYGVGSYLDVGAFDHDGSLGAYAIYAPQNADRLETGFREEIARMLDKGFTADEIAEAKKGWSQSRQVSRAQDGELAGSLVRHENQERTFAWDEAYEAKVLALTNDQIVAAMRKYLDPGKISIVQAGDFAKVKKAAGTEVKSGAAPQ